MSLIQPCDGAAHDTRATLFISFDGLCVKLTIDLRPIQYSALYQSLSENV